MAVAARQLEDEQTFAPPSQDRRHELGQFLTPRPVADYMASLFKARWQELDLLDAGAGDGALSAALVRRLCASRHKPKRISVTAFELDEILIESLRATLHDCQQECERAGIQFSAMVLNTDFIAAAVPMVRSDLFASRQSRFNAAI